MSQISNFLAWRMRVLTLHYRFSGMAAFILLPNLVLCQQAHPVRTAKQAVTTANPLTMPTTVDQAQADELAAERLNRLGPENGALSNQTGVFDVIETVWSAPGAPPIVTTNLVAQRQMIGSILEETIYSASDPAQKVLRLDYLSFNRLEGRWEYVSMDTRAAVGIMTAQSVGRERDDFIAIIFQPFSVPGPGREATGQMLRMREEITTQRPGVSQKDQFFTMADGTHTEWLAHRYHYLLRPSPAMGKSPSR